MKIESGQVAIVSGASRGGGRYVARMRVCEDMKVHRESERED